MTVEITGSRMTSQPNMRDDKRGLGQNGFGGASSDLPKECTTADLKATPAKDEVLEGGERHGAVSDAADQWQRRKIADRSFPDHPHMNRANDGNVRSIGVDTRPVKR